MKRKYNSCVIRVVNNGWEIDASAEYLFRGDSQRAAQNTFVFQKFDALSKWIEENVRPTGDE